MAASGNENVDIVHALIEAGADVHSQDKVYKLYTGQPVATLHNDSVIL